MLLLPPRGFSYNAYWSDHSIATNLSLVASSKHSMHRSCKFWQVVRHHRLPDPLPIRQLCNNRSTVDGAVALRVEHTLRQQQLPRRYPTHERRSSASPAAPCGASSGGQESNSLQVHKFACKSTGATQDRRQVITNKQLVRLQEQAKLARCREASKLHGCTARCKARCIADIGYPAEEEMRNVRFCQKKMEPNHTWLNRVIKGRSRDSFMTECMAMIEQPVNVQAKCIDAPYNHPLHS